MIEGDEFHLVEVGDFVQLLGDVDLILAVHRLERGAGDLHIFIVVDWKVAAIAGTRAERSDAEHIGDELKFLAVPGKDHRAGTGEALRLFDLEQRAPLFDAAHSGSGRWAR